MIGGARRNLEDSGHSSSRVFPINLSAVDMNDGSFDNPDVIGMHQVQNQRMGDIELGHVQRIIDGEGSADANFIA
jgi:hypothetical protein